MQRYKMIWRNKFVLFKAFFITLSKIYDGGYSSSCAILSRRQFMIQQFSFKSLTSIPVFKCSVIGCCQVMSKIPFLWSIDHWKQISIQNIEYILVTKILDYSPVTNSSHSNFLIIILRKSLNYKYYFSRK